MEEKAFEETMKNQIQKLLDKAGTNPKLTPRLLREKAEQRLKLQPGELNTRTRREIIKNVIIKWWNENVKKESAEPPPKISTKTPDEQTLHKLGKVVKAAGVGPQVFARLQDLSIPDRIIAIRAK